MRNKLTKYLRLLLIEILVICASILDPWLKMKLSITHNLTLEKEIESRFVLEASNHLTNSNEPSQLPEPSHEHGSVLIDLMYTMAHPKGNTVKNELQKYFSKPPEVKTINVLLFWKSWATIFPTLKEMGCKYLAIPATSAPAEQVFCCGHKRITYQNAFWSSIHVEQLFSLKDCRPVTQNQSTSMTAKYHKSMV
ncbi:hypothetical protein O181_118410 [Austropuccinia psidii MF-1]|uniref:HAT C-terminal dimerisation domain-containing protein n=1 Tax=Austropuccinia psidii MF-1 TaxID=1389203 RepID=A0A9Q3KGC0_9BASI|nr:hypothetical protein [Austropuccinia psidii MF-1]